MARANYEIVEDLTDRLVIRDLGPWDRFMSVTNDAENVVKELAGRLNGRRLFYYDSEGFLGELLVRGDGRFDGFHPSRIRFPPPIGG